MTSVLRRLATKVGCPKRDELLHPMEWVSNTFIDPFHRRSYSNLCRQFERVSVPVKLQAYWTRMIRPGCSQPLSAIRAVSNPLGSAYVVPLLTYYTWLVSGCSLLVSALGINYKAGKSPLFLPLSNKLLRKERVG